VCLLLRTSACGATTDLPPSAATTSVICHPIPPIASLTSAPRSSELLLCVPTIANLCLFCIYFCYLLPHTLETPALTSPLRSSELGSLLGPWIRHLLPEEELVGSSPTGRMQDVVAACINSCTE